MAQQNVPKFAIINVNAKSLGMVNACCSNSSKQKFKHGTQRHQKTGKSNDGCAVMDCCSNGRIFTNKHTIDLVISKLKRQALNFSRLSDVCTAWRELLTVGQSTGSRFTPNIMAAFEASLRKYNLNLKLGETLLACLGATMEKLLANASAFVTESELHWLCLARDVCILIYAHHLLGDLDTGAQVFQKINSWKQGMRELELVYEVHSYHRACSNFIYGTLGSLQSNLSENFRQSPGDSSAGEGTLFCCGGTDSGFSKNFHLQRPTLWHTLHLLNQWRRSSCSNKAFNNFRLCSQRQKSENWLDVAMSIFLLSCEARQNVAALEVLQYIIIVDQKSLSDWRLAIFFVDALHGVSALAQNSRITSLALSPRNRAASFRLLPVERCDHPQAETHNTTNRAPHQPQVRSDLEPVTGQPCKVPKGLFQLLRWTERSWGWLVQSEARLALLNLAEKKPVLAFQINLELHALNTQLEVDDRIWKTKSSRRFFWTGNETLAKTLWEKLVTIDNNFISQNKLSQ